MEGKVRIIHNKTGKVKMVSPQLANSRAMKAQGWHKEESPKKAMTFDDLKDDETADSGSSGSVDLLAGHDNADEEVTQKKTPAPKKPAKNSKK